MALFAIELYFGFALVFIPFFLAGRLPYFIQYVKWEWFQRGHPPE